MPITSIHESSIQEHFFKVAVIFSILFLPDPGVMKVGDTNILWISTDINNFAACCENFRRQHGELKQLEFDIKFDFYAPKRNILTIKFLSITYAPNSTFLL